MKKPTIRVIRWLGDIPVEASCSACSGVVFKATGSGHRPNREEYRRRECEEVLGASSAQASETARKTLYFPTCPTLLRSQIRMFPDMLCLFV